MLNKNGGIDNLSERLLKRAEDSDLITLPRDIQGTNCGNCSFFKDGFCNNQKVLQAVNGRMCCKWWDAKGTLRAWEKKDG